MRCLKTFPTYEEANARQLDLLAAKIDALVKYVPTGFQQVYYGTNPVYALFVDEDRFEEAAECLRLVPDEAHRCLYRCPKCDSNQVSELPLDAGFGTGPLSFPFTLGLVALGRMIRRKLRGTPYACHGCGHRYRKNP